MANIWLPNIVGLPNIGARGATASRVSTKGDIFWMEDSDLIKYDKNKNKYKELFRIPEHVFARSQYKYYYWKVESGFVCLFICVLLSFFFFCLLVSFSLFAPLFFPFSFLAFSQFRNFYNVGFFAFFFAAKVSIFFFLKNFAYVFFLENIGRGCMNQLNQLQES